MKKRFNMVILWQWQRSKSFGNLRGESLFGTKNQCSIRQNKKKMNCVFIDGQYWLIMLKEVMFTLKALTLTPLVFSRLWLALKEVSLAGSIGSLTSLFSARDNSSSRVSLENAPSSISEIMFPDRSILFRVTIDTCENYPLIAAILKFCC